MFNVEGWTHIMNAQIISHRFETIASWRVYTYHPSSSTHWQIIWSKKQLTHQLLHQNTDTEVLLSLHPWYKTPFHNTYQEFWKIPLGHQYYPHLMQDTYINFLPSLDVAFLWCSNMSFLDSPHNPFHWLEERLAGQWLCWRWQYCMSPIWCWVGNVFFGSISALPRLIHTPKFILY